MEKENKILVAVPTSGFCRNDAFYDFYNLMQRPLGTICTFARGQSPARNRNMMIQQAIDLEATHVLFLDDDTAFPPTLLNDLLRHDKDIVTALYLMRNYPHQPIIFDWAGPDGKCRWHSVLNEKPGLIEIVNCGLGACLINTRVFKAMEQPWITLGELEKDHWCDDISFFNRVREKGFKLYCDTSVCVGHYQSIAVWPMYVNNAWHVIYDSNGTNRVTFPMPVVTLKEEEEKRVPVGV